jgi:mRNA-degrading endonuclease RelE of RelBE toxin-antitoxin system
VSQPGIVHRGLICDNRIKSKRANSTDRCGTRDEVVMAFAIELSPHAHDHLKRLRKRDHRIIVDAIAVHLTHQPDQPTRHHKTLEDNPLAPWELRVGNFRVFYDVDRESETVVVVAIGQKIRNRLRIGDEEIEL